MPFGRRDLRNAGCICGNDLAENRVKANEKAIFPLLNKGTAKPAILRATLLHFSQQAPASWEDRNFDS